MPNVAYLRAVNRVVGVKAPTGAVTARKRERREVVRTRQVQFIQQTAGPVLDAGPVNAEMLQHWWLDRPKAEHVMPMLRGRVSGAMGKMDRFFLDYAMTVLEALQSKSFAGRAVINLSVAGLTDPLLPIYVVSQLQRRGLSLLGVSVALAPCFLHSAAPRRSRPYIASP